MDMSPFAIHLLRNESERNVAGDAIAYAET
jgi:hypothetical protein